MELSRDEKRNRDHWDRDAAEYHRRHHAALARRLSWGPSIPPESKLGVLGELRGKDVLEVGCGGAQAIVHLKRDAGVRRAAGADLSEGQIAHARRHAAEEGVEVELVAAPATDLSTFADGSFDVVFSAYALGFVADLGRAFQEAARVLRPGGLFAFSWASPLYQILEWRGSRVWVEGSYFERTPHRDAGDRAGPWTEFRRTYGDYLALLRQAGFELTDILEPKPLPVENSWREAYPLAVISRVPGTTIWRARRRLA